MLKIWGRTNSINVQKVLWCCAELDLKYRARGRRRQIRRQQHAEYLAMNPMDWCHDQRRWFHRWSKIPRHRALPIAQARKGSLCPSDEKAVRRRAIAGWSCTARRCGATCGRYSGTWSGSSRKRDMKLVEESRKKMADNLKMGGGHNPQTGSTCRNALTMGRHPDGSGSAPLFLLRSSAPITPGSRRTTSASSTSCFRGALRRSAELSAAQRRK